MTAFARESASIEQSELTIELRTVNHRYLDSSFKLPDGLRVLEPKLREMIGKTLARGKVDCMMRVQAHPERSASLLINKEILPFIMYIYVIKRKTFNIILNLSRYSVNYERNRLLYNI